MFDEYDDVAVLDAPVIPKKRGRKKKSEVNVAESYFTKLKKDNFNKKIANKRVTKAEPKHYINDAKFKALILNYHKLKSETPDMSVPEDIWKAFLLLANNIIRLPYFNKRLDKEDMIMNAVIKCIEKVDSFDITRESPFAYFTTIVRNSFWYSRKVANKMYYGDKDCYKDGVLDSFATHEQDDEFNGIQQDAMNYYE